MNKSITSSTFILLIFSAAIVSALTPNDEQWHAFAKSHSGIEALPHDDKLGRLVNLREPNPAWTDALERCETFFEMLEKGEIDSEKFFYAPVKLPLEKAFAEVLKHGPIKMERRYGLPKRNQDRIFIPIRLEGKDIPSYGHVYFVLDNEQWFIEQWVLDLSDMEVIQPEEEPVEQVVPELNEVTV